MARILLAYGHRLQKSVFEVWVEPDDTHQLCRDVGPLLDAEDLFELFPLDERGTRGRISWQRRIDSFDPVWLA